MCNLQETPGPGDPGSGAPLCAFALAAAALLLALRLRAVGGATALAVLCGAVLFDQTLLLHLAEKAHLGCDGHATGPQVR